MRNISGVTFTLHPNNVLLTERYSSHEPRGRQCSSRGSAQAGKVAIRLEVLEGGRNAHMVDPEKAAAAEADLEVLDVDVFGTRVVVAVLRVHLELLTRGDEGSGRALAAHSL